MNLKHSLIAGLLLAGSSLVHAQTLNFDIYAYGLGTGYTGLGAAPDLPANTYWNDIDGPGMTVGSDSAPNLLSDGVTNSNVTLTLGSGAGYFEGYGITPTLLLPYDYTLGSTVQTLTLNNVSTGTYSLYLYGINGAFADNATTFTVNGVTMSTVNSSAGTNGFVLGNNYVEFTGVTPNSSGTIDITYQADTALGVSEGDFNGLQLVQVQDVPEPGTLSMMSFGLSSLLFVTWLRSRKVKI